jgi:plastocyanin
MSTILRSPTAIRFALALTAIPLTAALLLVMSQRAPASPPATAAASGGRVRVDINHFRYQPSTLRIARGTRVVFLNSARIVHTATDGGVFDTGRIGPGRSVSVRFTRRGTFSYRCTIHPFMRGKVVVR